MPIQRYGENLGFLEGNRPHEINQPMPEIFSEAEHKIVRRMQKQHLYEVSELFPLKHEDHQSVDLSSQVMKEGFEKHYHQFCAAARGTSGKMYVDLQIDCKIGNDSTCAEYAVMTEAEDAGDSLTSLAVARGESRIIKDPNGDLNQFFSHSVVPCAHCRENLQNRHKHCEVVVNRDYDQNMKLPISALYPTEEMLASVNGWEDFQKAGFSAEFVEARKMQQIFFRAVASRYPLTENDQRLYGESLDAIQKLNSEEREIVLIKGITKAGKEILKQGELPKEDPAFVWKAKYTFNKIEWSFTQEMLKQPHYPALNKRRPGHVEALHTFIELKKIPGQEPRIVLPSAMGREHVDQFNHLALVLVNLEGKLAKLPATLLYPWKFVRLDKKKRV